MGLILFVVVFLVAIGITRLLADVLKLRFYTDHAHVHHVAYCLFLLPTSWILYEYHYTLCAETVGAIAYALMVSEVHLLITPTLRVMYARLNQRIVDKIRTSKTSEKAIIEPITSKMTQLAKEIKAARDELSKSRKKSKDVIEP